MSDGRLVIMAVAVDANDLLTEPTPHDTSILVYIHQCTVESQPSEGKPAGNQPT